MSTSTPRKADASRTNVSKLPGKAKEATPREAILKAAIKLFGAKGYSGTTMRDIAQEVGILAGSLYAHIDSKENLLAEIVQSGFEPYLEVLRKLESASLTPSAKLRALIIGHVMVVAENLELTFVVVREWRFLTEPNRSKVVKMRRRYGQAFIQIVEAGVAGGEFSSELEVRVAVFGILGALNWIPEWYSPQGPSSAETIGNQLADSLIGGLKSPRPRSKSSTAVRT